MLLLTIASSLGCDPTAGHRPGCSWSPCSSARSPSPGSVSCSRVPCGPRRPWRWPTRLFVVALLLGGIILPLDHLPGPLAAIAGLLPAAALSDAFRIALGSGGDALRPLAILAAWAAGSVALAVRTFRWD